MKKLLLVASLSTLMAGSALAEAYKPTVKNGEGMLTVTADMKAETCELAVEKNVMFGNIWFNSTNPSDFQKNVAFQVTNCSQTTGDSLKVTFTPVSGTVSEGKLMNLSNGDAKAENVFLVVKDANNKNVLAADYDATGVDTWSLDPNDNPGQAGQKLSKTFTYTLELEKGEGATAGVFMTTLPYSVHYK
ncbi:MAG: fimbrial protein [Pasteurellaceae bacterium]|nr:fimbrial protein [Pasteurellaceae bacterium]